MDVFEFIREHSLSSAVHHEVGATGPRTVPHSRSGVSLLLQYRRALEKSEVLGALTLQISNPTTHS